MNNNYVVLELTDEHLGAEMLSGGDVGLYDDNGAGPDGPACFPQEPFFDRAIVDAGFGRRVAGVFYYDSCAEMRAALRARGYAVPKAASAAEEYVQLREWLSVHLPISVRWSAYSKDAVFAVRW